MTDWIPIETRKPTEEDARQGLVLFQDGDGYYWLDQWESIRACPSKTYVAFQPLPPPFVPEPPKVQQDELKELLESIRNAFHYSSERSVVSKIARELYHLKAESCRIPVAEAPPLEQSVSPLPEGDEPSEPQPESRPTNETPVVDWDSVPSHINWVTWSPGYGWVGWTTKPGLQYYPSGNSRWCNSVGRDAKSLPRWPDFKGNWHDSIQQRPRPVEADPTKEYGDYKCMHGVPSKTCSICSAPARRTPTKEDLKNGPIKAWCWEYGEKRECVLLEIVDAYRPFLVEWEGSRIHRKHCEIDAQINVSDSMKDGLQ